MAGTLISDYGLNDHWTELLQSIEKARKGYLGLSLTNYDNSSLPAVVAGSYVEAIGALYGFASEEAIGGSPTTANINYIVFDPAPITLAWSIVAPTWNAAKNGWYDAGEAKRYVAGCYYVDTPTYTEKWVYRERGIRRYHIEENAIDSEHYRDGSIDAVHLASNSVTAVKILKTFTGGSQEIGATSTWVPPVGIYNIAMESANIYLSIYVSGAWHGTQGGLNGLIYCDGTNMRIGNGDGVPRTIYYQKFD